MSNIHIGRDRIGAMVSEKIMEDVVPLFSAATLMYDGKITFAEEMEMLNSIVDKNGRETHD